MGEGFNVGINVGSTQIIYNDKEPHVVELMQYLKDNELKTALLEIDRLINRYSLSKENAEGFNQLRNYYNEENNSPIVFYTLICYAFNYQIRFNQQGKYNMPFGKARSSFNPALRQKFITFVEAIHKRDCKFLNISFTEFDFNTLTKNDLVYCDTPYLNSVATYNEQGGWTEECERELLSVLDELDKRGIRFALSNNLKYKNPLLEEWKNKYNVHYLTGNYSNCNYHKIDRSNDTEVLITNYT